MSLECFVLNCNLQFEYGILWWPGPITNWKRSIDFEKVPRHFEETLSLSRFQSVWLWKKTLQEEVVHHLKRSSTLWCPLKGAALWRTRPAHSLTLLFWFITFKLMATCFYVPLQSADVYVLVSIFFLVLPFISKWKWCAWKHLVSCQICSRFARSLMYFDSHLGRIQWIFDMWRYVGLSRVSCRPRFVLIGTTASIEWLVNHRMLLYFLLSFQPFEKFSIHPQTFCFIIRFPRNHGKDWSPIPVWL